KDIKVEDLRKELDKSDINGEKLSPNFSMYNQEATVYKDSVMIGSVDVPTKELVKGIGESEDEINEYTWNAHDYDNPVITLNGKDIELDKLTKEVVEEDVK